MWGHMKKKIPWHTLKVVYKEYSEFINIQTYVTVCWKGLNGTQGKSRKDI